MNPRLQSTSADALRDIFAKADSLFERLIYVAGARDPETGHYVDPLLSLSYAANDIDQQFREQHRYIFVAWLTLTIEKQYAELRRYLYGKREQQALIQKMRQQEWYERLIPTNASSAERNLFRSDFEIVTAVACSYCDVQPNPSLPPSACPRSEFQHAPGSAAVASMSWRGPTSLCLAAPRRTF